MAGLKTDVTDRLKVAIRQAAKPAADYMQRRAEVSPAFRSLCIRCATVYHHLEYRLVQSFYERRYHSHVDVPKLDPTRAVQLGTRLFGEAIVFSIAAGLLFGEYQRGVFKEAAKENRLASRLSQLEEGMEVVMERLSKIEQTQKEQGDAGGGGALGQQSTTTAEAVSSLPAPQSSLIKPVTRSSQWHKTSKTGIASSPKIALLGASDLQASGSPSISQDASSQAASD